MKTIVRLKSIKTAYEYLAYIEDDPSIYLAPGALVDTLPVFQDFYEGKPKLARVTLPPVQVDEKFIELELIRVDDYVCSIYPTVTMLHKPNGLDGSRDEEQDRL